MEQIGEGGFGLVFVAEQERPIRRKVALKIIKPGMDTQDVIARFEAERQALALMDHPNIARVLDAGTTDSGRPVLRDGAGPRHSHYRLLRQAPAHAARAVRTLRPGLQRHPARPLEGDHSPRHQALQRARYTARLQTGGESDRLRRGQGPAPAAHGPHVYTRFAR